MAITVPCSGDNGSATGGAGVVWLEVRNYATVSHRGADEIGAKHPQRPVLHRATEDEHDASCSDADAQVVPRLLRRELFIIVEREENPASNRETCAWWGMIQNPAKESPGAS